MNSAVWWAAYTWCVCLWKPCCLSHLNRGSSYCEMNVKHSFSTDPQQIMTLTRTFPSATNGPVGGYVETYQIGEYQLTKWPFNQVEHGDLGLRALARNVIANLGSCWLSTYSLQRTSKNVVCLQNVFTLPKGFEEGRKCPMRTIRNRHTTLIYWFSLCWGRQRMRRYVLKPCSTLHRQNAKKVFTITIGKRYIFNGKWQLLQVIVCVVHDIHVRVKERMHTYVLLYFRR